MESKSKRNLLDVFYEENSIIIKPTGKDGRELNIYNTSEIHPMIKSIIDRAKPEQVIFDMENIDFIDSSAVGVFIDIYNHCSKSGNFRIVFVNMKEMVRKVLRLLYTESIFHFESSVENAIKIHAAV